ncbi:ribonucleases P/MRP protein subunit POP1 [Drosophila pseudoobscura]|uniref:Ribonucleases P/MRP protein subunit POP1 n=1 Tax=Drosophila pseudoobscura pseudoobscura TaxID=46245 RepID=A0A6I8UYW9_DROPS|nr:ribonucleases P/MRP protein subunit POP1 [Drosophila pseudoobscura]XP_033238978.1 ribonucleases P/MRP protein subunit POP1 [Drosophila pseudoobscura]
MSTQKLEYDARMGGRITLPTHVSTYRYAAGALNEIKGLIAEALNPVSSKLIFQSLPKHMRRRAMSHHPKRLPRKYRHAHKNQMSKGGNDPVLRKRPSRKYRRRPGNLLKEYVRRQRRHHWLETHIWHAKRFHMVDRWGYRLANASCDKTYRACYRASVQHCLLQDISYYTCVELQGSLESLRKGFARLTSPECGLSVTARTFLTGRREGSVELFADSQYPRGALQRASFMWRPLEEGVTSTEDTRTLWLWLHPSAAQATVEQLQRVFLLQSRRQQTLPLEEKPAKEQKEKPLRFWTQTKAFERHAHYSNTNGSIQLLVLRQEFNRFRLTGPQAQRVLASSLRAHRRDQLGVQAAQADYCEAAFRLHSPNELLSNLIMGLHIVDPRLQRPCKRTKAESCAGAVPAGNLLLSPPECLARSPLWQREERERLARGIMSTHHYQELRQQHAVVPGVPCAFEDQMQAVPLLLIQRPGSQDPEYKRLGYGCGWDVIAPAKYGMALWLTLTMWGARPGGLRELDSVARESGGEQHLADTLAGVKLASAAAEERRARYFRLPPNKRTNYRKLAVASPFSAPWKHLVRDWQTTAATSSPAVGSYHVLRHRELLESIGDCLRLHQPLPDQVPDDCLIQIQLRLKARGHVKDNALICLPSAADYKQRWRQINRNEQAPVHVEPPQPDLNERTRKELRSDHKIKLKRLRARRVREKRRLQETATKRVHIRPANTAPLVRAHLLEMCRLWLPTDPAETSDSVRRQCSREVFGYVTTAGFSFTEATVCAVGYVTPGGLQHLLSNLKDSKGRQLQPMCLVRDPDSRDYRWATVQVNLNVAAQTF